MTHAMNTMNTTDPAVISSHSTNKLKKTGEESQEATKQLIQRERNQDQRRNLHFLEGDLMETTRWLCVCGLVITALLPVGWQMVMKDLADESRWQSFERESAQSFTSNVKRHSEGTFTSDFTRHLDNMKAKDFVHWLINTKRYSFRKRSVNEKPDTLKYLPGPFWFRYN